MKKTGLFILISICFLLVNSSCKKEDTGVNKIVDVVLAPNQAYSYKISGLGDKDDVIKITTDASHAMVSKLSATNGAAPFLFEYTPALNYIGTDVVVVSSVEGAKSGSCKGSGHKCGSHQEENDQITFKITIKGSSE